MFSFFFFISFTSNALIDAYILKRGENKQMCENSVTLHFKAREK